MIECLPQMQTRVAEAIAAGVDLAKEAYDLLAPRVRRGTQVVGFSSVALLAACSGGKGPEVPIDISVQPTPIKVEMGVKQWCTDWEATYKRTLPTHGPETISDKDTKCSLRYSEVLHPCPDIKEANKNIYRRQTCTSGTPYQR